MKEANTAFTPLNMFGWYIWSNKVQFTKRDTKNTYISEVMNIDLTNERVGIGNSNPTQKLHVGGNILASGTITASGGFSGNLTGNASSATTATNATTSASCSGNSATATKLSNRGNLTAITSGGGEAGLNNYTVYNNGYPCNYGNLIHVNNTGGSELLLGWSGTNNGIERMYYRNKRDQATTWSDWRTVAYTTDILTNTNQLTNGAGFITSAGSCAYATSAGSASSATNADTVDSIHVWTGTLAQYNAISSKSSTTLYFITG